MLVLTRKQGEQIQIGDVTVTLVAIRGDRVRLGIDAPRDVAVHRREVLDAINRSAGEPGAADGSEPEVAGG